MNTISILIISILSILFATPYGTWEFKNENKPGGIFVYFTCALCLTAAIINFFFI